MRATLALLSSVLVTALSHAAVAQSEAEIIENLVAVAEDVCVGPGMIDADDEVLDALSLIPDADCRRICKLNQRGCVSTTRAIDKCAKTLLRASAKIGRVFARSTTATNADVSRRLRAATSEFVARSELERAQCVDFTETCLGFCE